MKIWFWILPFVVLAGLGVRYWLQRRREEKAQREGMVLYATIISLEPVTVFGKPSPVMKIKLWLQEPGGKRRDVQFNSRVAEGQNVVPGAMLPVVIDPRDPKRVQPAGEAAMKRVQLTGSRDQRRMMKRKL